MYREKVLYNREKIYKVVKQIEEQHGRIPNKEKLLEKISHVILESTKDRTITWIVLKDQHYLRYVLH